MSYIIKKMGTQEVYNYEQQKWVPYVSDPDKWYQHLLDMRDGLVEPDYLGRYIVGSGEKHRRHKEMEAKQIENQRPVVNLVSPVAQATEMARWSSVSHLSYEHGSQGINMEDFLEAGVQDQGNALRQGFGKFHFQSAVSFSLGIKGIVRIHLQDVQTITFGIVVLVNVNVLPEGGQRSVAVYVLIGLVVGAQGL